ncbi:hypothetical protein [Actinoplanes sp. NPDC020271]|uniref:hypothetical protein n=1 Tax=Actinoplanes sp. NPDC020271 TaxID=3363896 RepID=UPI003798FB5B
MTSMAEAAEWGRGPVVRRMSVLLGVWAVGSIVLFLLGMRDLFTFGDAAPAHAARGGAFLLACAFLLIAAPVAATVIGARGGQNVYAGVCAVLALGGLVLGGLLAVRGLQETGAITKPAVVVPTPRTSHCVEFSGGDTRCPGG